MAVGERELLLLRHGYAQRADGGSDLARELTDPGKRDIQRVGVHLQAHGWLPDAAVASPATRTQITAEKALKAGGRGTDGLATDRRIYDASLSTLVQVLAGFAEGPGRVMVVGHNPGLSELASFLCERPTALSPGTLVRFAMPADWTSLRPGCAECLDLVDPETLPRDFPFPAPHGPQRRSRPAYYYVQSGVVPYRRTESGLEVMLIGSSKRKRWVVPKGIVTPGLTPQQSAAKEAREEAGIEGTVGGPSLGVFSYEKWGAPVTCEVYPMLVTKVLSEADWEERHRGRQWFSPEVALKTLGREGLEPMVTELAARLAPHV